MMSGLASTSAKPLLSVRFFGRVAAVKQKEQGRIAMANQKQVKRLTQDVTSWNAWRAEHSTIRPDLRKADLSDANLNGVDLSRADLRDATLLMADLCRANLSGADLRKANLN